MSANAQTSAKAKTMRLEKTEGTVEVENSSKGELIQSDGMRLASGDDLNTDEASYAWVSLDDAKALKVDEVSEVEVRQRGKNLEALLVSGNIFFNVTVPLKSDESLNIRTSTMATGIRGTCGWISIVDGCNTRVHLLEGVLQCKVINPVDGKIKTVTIHAGETADFTVYGVEVKSNMPAKSSEIDVTGQPYKSDNSGTSEKNISSGSTSDKTKTDSSNESSTGLNKADNSVSGSDSAGNETADSNGSSESNISDSSDNGSSSSSSEDSSSSETGSFESGNSDESTPVTSSGSTSAPTVSKSKAPVSPDGESCDIIMDKFGREDIPAFVLAELIGDEPLIESIYVQSGIDLRDLTQGEVDKKLKETQAETAARMAEIHEAEAAQANNISKDPVWERNPDKTASAGESTDPDVLGQNTTPSPSPSPSSSNKPAQNTPSAGETKSVQTQDAPADTNTAASAPATEASSNNNDAPSAGSSSGTPDPANTSNTNTNSNPPSSTIELTMPQTATTVQGYLDQAGINAVILNPGTGNNTLDVDIDFTVPAGKNLTANSSVPVVVDSGKSATINGTADLRDSLTNNGTITVNSSHTLKVAGVFTNAGTTNNTSTGNCEFASAVNNTGTLITSGTMLLNLPMTTSGNLTISGGTVTANGGISANSGTVDISGGSLTSNTTALSIAGAALTMSGGSIESQATALSFSNGSFTMDGGMITSPTSGQTVILNTHSGVQLNSGTINNEGDGAVFTGNGATGFNNNWVLPGMNILGKSDNMLGDGPLSGNQNIAKVIAVGLYSVFGGTGIGFRGRIYDPNTIHTLTLNANVSPNCGYTINTITTPGNPVYVEDGVKVPLTVTPDTGYGIDSVRFVNTSITPNTDWNISYTLGSSTEFTMPSGPVDIVVAASKINYTLAAPSSITGGTITLNPVTSSTVANTANYQDTVNVSAVPASGYELKSLTYTVAGSTTPIAITTNASGEGSFTMPDGNVSVSAVFELKTYNLTVNTNGTVTGGSVSITGNKTNAKMGDNISLTVTPNTGYQLKKLAYTVDSDPTETDISSNKSFNMPAGTVNIIAEFELISYDPNTGIPTNIQNGSMSVTPAGAHMGDTVTLAINPDTGYQIKRLAIKNSAGVPVAYSPAFNPLVNTYTFTMPAGNVTYEIEFEKIPHTITISAATGGSIVTAPAMATAGYGDTVTVSAVPAAGYQFKSLKYTPQGGIAHNLTATSTPNLYSFSMPNADVTITGEFEKITYNAGSGIPASISNGGMSVSPTNAQMGDTVTVTLSPSTGYQPKSFAIKDSLNNSVTYSPAFSASQLTYTFEMPAGNVTYEVEFEKIPRNITISAATGGSIVTAPARATAGYGDTVTVSAVPADGYQFKSLKYTPQGDSAHNLTATSTTNLYSFTMPNADVTVTGEFELIDYNTSTGIPSSIANGGMSVSPSSAQMGDTVTVTLNPATGYQPSSFAIKDSSNNPVSYSPAFNASQLTYTFTMPAGNVTYDVEYELINHIITVNNPTGGTVSASNTANYNDTVTVTVSPADGYKLKSLKYNDGSDHNISITAAPYTFTMPNTSVSVIGEFELIDYNTSTGIPSSIANGGMSVSPSSAQMGDTVTVTLNPATGYQPSSFAIKDSSNNPVSYCPAFNASQLTYTFTMPAGNVTYEVEFELIRYSITLNLNTGTGTTARINSGNVTEYTYGTVVTLPTNVTRDSTATDNYVFEGWFTDPTSGTRVETIAANESGDKVYYAHWHTTPRAYNVTLNTNGGTINAGNITTYTTGVATPLPTNVTKSGFTFGGWFTTNNPSQSDVAVTSIPATATGPQVFYAKWTQTTVTHGITITGNFTHGNLYKVNPGNQFDAGDDIYLEVIPELGYKVKELYYIESTSSAHVIILNDSFVMPNSDVTIYVDFEIENYSITYDLNANGDTSAQMPAGAITAYTYGTTFNLPTGVTRNGYTFDGWYTQASGGLRTAKIKATDTGNKRFYAHWSQAPVSYNVSIASTSNGTVTADTSTAVSGDTVTLTVTPANNYDLLDITAQTDAGLPLTLTHESYNSSTNTYSFVLVMPGDNVTVSAVFYEDNPSVTYYDAIISSLIHDGNIETDKPHYEAGDTVVITVIPDQNYELSSDPVVLGDTSGNIINITDISSGTEIKYSFQMPSEDVRISATFTYIVMTYGISSTYSTAGGTVSVTDSGDNVITSSVSGEDITVKIKPNSGYSFAGKSSLTISILLNSPFGSFYDSLDPSDIAGSDFPDSNGFYEYVFTMPYSDITIFVEFESNSAAQSSITIDSTTLHGTITPDKTSARAGEIITLTAVPDTGYTLSSITVKDASNNTIALSDQFTFGMPEGNVTVTGVFVPVYEISPSYDTHKFRGIGFYDSVSGQSLESFSGVAAKAGDTVIVSAEILNSSVIFDGITVTGAGGSVVPAQFIERREEQSSSMTGPSVTHVYYDYSFTMPASAVTVTANATARRINISSLKTYYYDSYTNSMTEDTSGTCGTAQLDRTSGEPGDTLTLSLSSNTGYYCYAWSIYETADQTNAVQSAVTSDVVGIDLDDYYSYDQGVAVIFTDLTSAQYGLSVSTDDLVYLRIDRQTAATGQTVYVTVHSPDGKYCRNLRLIDENDDTIATVPAGNIENGIVNFDMPPCDLEIKADWGEYHTITKDYNTRAGSVTINGSNSDSVYAIEGDSISISASPNSGYFVVSALITYTTQTWEENGKGGGYWADTPVSRSVALSNGVGSFTMPDSDVVVYVEFESTSSTTYDIEIDSVSISNGTVTTNVTGDSSLAGRYITITAEPDPGYKLVSLVVRDSSNNVIQTVSTVTTTGNEFSFYMPDENVSVTATFERYYSIDYAGDDENVYFIEQPTFGIVGQSVIIDVNDYKTVNNGNYHKLDRIEYVYVENGNTISNTLVKNSDGNYSFIMPEADVTVNVYNESGTVYYDVDVSVESGQGTWTASSSKVAGSGNIDYTITPASGYILQKVEYGARKYSFNPLNYQTTEYAPIKYTATPQRNSDGTYSYSFFMYSNYYTYGGISGEQRRPHVWLYFVKESFDINVASSISGGTITPSDNSAEVGDTVTLTVSADTDYSLKNISVSTTSGANIALIYSNGTYSFTMPASAVTISAEFVEDSNVGTATGTTSDDWFSDKDFVRITSDTTLDTLLTVPSGKTLTIASGITVNASAGVTIESGAILNNYGTFNNSGTMTNNGTFNNYSSNTLNNYGTIINNGTLVNGDGASNDGRLNNFDGAVIENNGTIINNEGSVVNNEGEIEGNDIVGEGEVNDESEDPSPVSGDAALIDNDQTDPEDSSSDDRRSGIEATTDDESEEDRDEDDDDSEEDEEDEDNRANSDPSPINTESRDAESESGDNTTSGSGDADI